MKRKLVFKDLILQNKTEILRDKEKLEIIDIKIDKKHTLNLSKSALKA
ncbi:FbpB family small basic protein [Bacillus sp. 03113]|nr:FbpB family small basic protein [Bacillus sp. 03113]